ncbi:ATP-dependent DNA helicase pif1-like [Hydra vulgaris]|uniref:ATP-dependent DNA helicase pif1-like n=1 Tax=Hydra vulgaris TaxID=6087 RepID=A0ABM4CU69_HYDVU
MFNDNDDIEMDDRLNEVMYLQDDVSALQNNYIDAEVLTGVSGNKRVFVPRIHLAPSDSNLPFVLKRRQFPVRLAYSMTINKSQGQKFDRVGVYLKKPCFSHGQLYVACSRTRAFNSFFSKLINISFKLYICQNYVVSMFSKWCDLALC